MTTVNPYASVNPAASSASSSSGFSALGSGDFMKLMTTQLTQQDPFEPVDQKEMLAQMAQFSALAGTTEMGDTLKAISAKLDTLVTTQNATNDAVAGLAAQLAGQS
jgi:flagellar basal-body rod modification protein FlgD